MRIFPYNYAHSSLYHRSFHSPMKFSQIFPSEIRHSCHPKSNYRCLMTAAISVFSGLRAAGAAARFFLHFFTMQYFFFLCCAALTSTAASPAFPYAAHCEYKPYRNHSKDCIIKRFHFPAPLSESKRIFRIRFAVYKILRDPTAALQEQPKNMVYHKSRQPRDTTLQKHYRQRPSS